MNQQSWPIPQHRKVSGLSGNEIFCLNQVGAQPGQLCVGNSVVALGIGGGLTASLSTLGGGEVAEITQLVHNGRINSFNRMMEEAKRYGGVGLTGVTFEMVNHARYLEFITTGSTVHAGDDAIREHFYTGKTFSTSANAQELYSQLDAGFAPHHFVFGNVAYSIGVGGSIAGALRGMARGEVPQYTEIFDRTRHLALNRIVQEAKRFGANAVIGIETTISPLLGAQEMMMVGTASTHPALESYKENPVTSDMTNEEMWNMVNLGFLPIRLVMGVSVYSLGLAGGIGAFLNTLGGGEVSGLTDILYEAREKALARIEIEAEKCGADEVVGVKTRIYDLGGGLVEFMAIGTAVKKFPNVTTKSPNIIPQAIIQDRDTFVDSTENATTTNLGLGTKASATKLQSGPLTIIVFIFFVVFYILKVFFLRSIH